MKLNLFIENLLTTGVVEIGNELQLPEEAEQPAHPQHPHAQSPKNGIQSHYVHLYLCTHRTLSELLCLQKPAFLVGGDSGPIRAREQASSPSA